jgi:putative MFS transporter
VPATGRAGATSYDEIPLNRFHLEITALTFCANFSDGYELGIIGIALPRSAHSCTPRSGRG